MSVKFIEYYYYKGLEFKITKEKNTYFARCQEISAYSDDLLDLKESKIPLKYSSCREFKL